MDTDGKQAVGCAWFLVWNCTKPPCTDAGQEQGISLGKGSDTLQGRMDDIAMQLSGKFRTVVPFQ
jgi:hypothetical protein